jgi:hypothetical protein
MVWVRGTTFPTQGDLRLAALALCSSTLQTIDRAFRAAVWKASPNARRGHSTPGCDFENGVPGTFYTGVRLLSDVLG